MAASTARACGMCGKAETEADSVFHLECRHALVCLPCGTNMVKASSSCKQCGVAVKRLVKEYALRAQPNRKQHLLGKFGGGLPGLKPKKGEPGVAWEIATTHDASNPDQENLVLQATNGHKRKYDGAHEGGQKNNYYLFVMQGADFMALPAGEWYNFKPSIKYATFSLEEAEARMANRARAAEGATKFMARGDMGTARALPGGAAGDGDDEDGVLDPDQVANAPKIKSEGQGEGAVGPAAGNGAAAGESTKPAPKSEEDGNGEDWEYDDDRWDDDDEAVGVGDQTLADDDDDPADTNAWRKMRSELAKQGKEEEEALDNEELTGSGKELKKLLGKIGLDDDDDEELEDEDDEDDIDPDEEDFDLMPLRRPSAMVDEKPSEGSVKGEAAEGSLGPIATGDDDARPAKMRKAVGVAAEEEKPAAAAAAAAPAPGTSSTGSGAGAGASGRVAGKAAGGAGGRVTDAELRAFLTSHSGKVTIMELLGHFKKRLKSSEDQKAFKTLMLKIAKLTEIKNPNGTSTKVLVLK